LSATIAIINAHIKTLNPHQPSAQAVAIENNRILKVGTRQDIEPLIGEKTLLMDLGGKTVLPGLIDTHIHVADYGRCLMWLDLTTAKSICELQQLLKQKVDQTPSDGWIVGQGWNETRFQEKRMPTAADLDLVAPNNPVILYREAAMLCVANTPALKHANVTPTTPTPLGGTIDKTPQGTPTGIFHNSAVTLIWQVVSKPAQAELLSATALACQKIFQAGITSLHWFVLSEDELAIIQSLYEQNQLLFRVNVVVPHALLEKTRCLKSKNPDVLRVSGVFIVADGYLDSKEAALTQPYSDDPNNTGKLFLSKETLSASVMDALSFGVQPIIHAMGDQALDLALSVIEQTKSPTRFRIEQAAVLNPDLIERLKKQNTAISIQPRVISSEFSVWSVDQRLGPRAKWLHPLKTLLDAGVVVAAGSDCPMEPLNPMLGIQELLLRPSYPEQRLSLDEALSLYTINAARCAAEETTKGSIQEGKLADLIVLNTDPTTIEPHKISEITIDFVILNGQILVVTL